MSAETVNLILWIPILILFFFTGKVIIAAMIRGRVNSQRYQPGDRNPNTVILRGRGAIMEAAAILAQKDTGRYQDVDRILLPEEDVRDALDGGDYATQVNFQWMIQHHNGEFGVIWKSDEEVL